MPEGNEIHRWAERHEAAFGGKAVRVDGPQGRFTDVDVIDGRKLRRVRAVGKHLGYDFGEDRILHIHMGLRGDFTEGSGPLQEVRGALRLRMWNGAAVKKAAADGEEPKLSKRPARYSEDDGSGALEPERIAWVELRGPTDCSIYTEAKWRELEQRLGPDPLDEASPERALAKIQKSKKSIAALLMDQGVIAGLGNIYRAELLYRAGVSPFLEGRAVPEDRLRTIWKDAALLLRAGMVDRRIVTTRPEDRPSSKEKSKASKKGSSGNGGAVAEKVARDEAHYVYRRSGLPCFVCGTKIRQQELEGRKLYWCPRCQEGPA